MLGPVIFVLYISDIYDIVKFHDLGVHFYAVDTQFYIRLNPATEQCIVIGKIESCLNDVTSFMNLNYLKLNTDKINVIFQANPRILNTYRMNMDIGSQNFTSNSNNKLKILGVTIN